MEYVARTSLSPLVSRPSGGPVLLLEFRNGVRKLPTQGPCRRDAKGRQGVDFVAMRVSGSGRMATTAGLGSERFTVVTEICRGALYSWGLTEVAPGAGLRYS